MVTKLTALLPEMLEKKYIKLWLFLNKIIPFLIIVILNNVALAIKKSLTPLQGGYGIVYFSLSKMVTKLTVF